MWERAANSGKPGEGSSKGIGRNGMLIAREAMFTAEPMKGELAFNLESWSVLWGGEKEIGENPVVGKARTEGHGG